MAGHWCGGSLSYPVCPDLGGFIFLSDYSFVLYGFFIIISASVVIYLYNARGIPDFKLVWMLPIIVLPVVGSLLYLLFYHAAGYETDL